MKETKSAPALLSTVEDVGNILGGVGNALLSGVPPIEEKLQAPRERVLKRHEQAKQAVSDYIKANRLASGSRLPTEEILCRHFGWSRTTIVRALNELAAEGTLKRVQGSGTFVTSSIKGNCRILFASPPWTEGDDYCGPLIAGLLQAAAENGVDITFHCQPEPDIEQLKEMKVDGIITLWWSVDDLRIVKCLHDAEIRVVGLAQRSRIHTLPLLCTDNYSGMREVVTHLVENGHQRIAYTCMNMGNSDNVERVLALSSTLAKSGLALEPAYFNLQLDDSERDSEQFEAWWCSMAPKPTAMVVDGKDAHALFLALSRQNVRIPEDLSIVMWDERNAWKNHQPALTVVKQPTYEMGRRAVTKLLAMLHAEDDGSPEIFPVELIKRSSVRSIL